MEALGRKISRYLLWVAEPAQTQSRAPLDSLSNNIPFNSIKEEFMFSFTREVLKFRDSKGLNSRVRCLDRLEMVVPQ